MSDPINRQDIIDAICTWDKFGVDERNRVVRWYEGLEPYVHLRDVVWAIEKMPSAQRKGKWIATKEWGGRNYSCSCCKFSFIVDTCMLEPMWNFCPNCGADMRSDNAPLADDDSIYR